MVSGWFAPFDLSSDGGGTASMTLGCSDDFFAVRLGFPNVTHRAWSITRAIARPSSSFNDYVTPTGNSPWTTFTTAGAGRDSTEIVSRNDCPTEIEVRELDDTALARAGRVSWTWTDWAPIRSQTPDPATGMRVLMLRALLPPSQTVTHANGQLSKFTGNRTVNKGHDIFIGGLKFNIDMVSDPDRKQPATTQTWIDNQLAPGTLFPMVQLMTAKPGISGIATGDSHAQGTSTTEQFSSFLLGATGLLTQSYFNKIPFNMTNCAVGGLGSEEFFARFESLLNAVQPSYAVLPGWTYNDKTGVTHADQTAMNTFVARLLNAADICDVNGILPVILTPFPRNAEAMTEVQLAPWHWLREKLIALRDSGTIVVDATAILGRQENGIFNGTYLPPMSTDHMHPNDDGHMAIGKAIANIVKTHL